MTPARAARIRAQRIEGKRQSWKEIREAAKVVKWTTKMPKVNNLRTEDLNPEQLAALRESINTGHDYQAANFMRMALFNGMRRGELLQLKWADLDFDRGFIHIRQPKGGKDQTIPLQKLLTHQNPQMTIRYAHLRDEALRRASDRVAVKNLQTKRRGAPGCAASTTPSACCPGGSSSWRLIPLTYFLDYFRHFYGFPLTSRHPLLYGFGQSVLYIIVSYGLVSLTLKSACKRGTLRRLSD